MSPREIPAEDTARDLVDGHPCVRVDAYLKLRDQVAALREQRAAAVKLHGGGLYVAKGEDDDYTSVEVCETCMDIAEAADTSGEGDVPDSVLYPCATARALGVTG